MRYELYYWPQVQGRGEFVRLVLEEAGADYIDVARLPAKRGGGERSLLRLLESRRAERPAFAPPFLKAGQRVVGQTANILLFLGPRLGLAPKGEAERLWLHQLQLTVADWLEEVHGTHHPIASSLYYRDQRAAAKLAAGHFLEERLPKFLGYFERIARRSRSGWIAGARRSYVDLSLFQMLEGLRYAFPASLERLERRYPRLVALHDRVAERPNLAAYLASERRVAFNEDGIFRHYPSSTREAARDVKRAAP